VSAYQTSATVSRIFPATTVVVAAPKGSSNGEHFIMPTLREPVVVIHFRIYFSRKILRCIFRKPGPESHFCWHLSSELYCQESSWQMHWRRYGYINHHSPADHDETTESRHWRWQDCCHYDSSLRAGYSKITVTVSPIGS